ncbi:MAG: hypothetical protein K2W94_01145 [Alphaproteobacteria bacterium]|nr:hypothetical protein [Alphaproteobacteria bacterium]
MPKISYIILSLVFLYLGDMILCHTPYADDGIPPDLERMLQNPSLSSSRDESFTSYVTKPFAEHPQKNMNFFSNPKTFLTEWNRRYQAYTLGKDKTIGLFKIFETMGASRRSILLNGDLKYNRIHQAETKGMINILKSDFGSNLASAEKDIVAKELLNIASSLEFPEILEIVDEFKDLYLTHVDLKKKRYFQILALLILRGYDEKAICKTEWYLEGMNSFEQQNLLARIEDYAHRFLPVPMDVDPQPNTIEETRDGANSPTPDAERHFRELVLNANNKSWNIVSSLLSSPLINELQKSPAHLFIIEAIRRLNDAHNGISKEDYDPHYDQQTLNKAVLRFRQSPASNPVFVLQQIQDYLSHTRVLHVFFDRKLQKYAKKSLTKALLNYVKSNNNKWPGINKLKINEQFFLNMHDPMYNTTFNEINFLEDLFQKPLRSWQTFLDFCEPYFVAKTMRAKRDRMRALIPFFQAFSTSEEIASFQEFCEPYLAGIEERHKPANMKYLLPIYQAFPTQEKRADFLKFCESYFVEISGQMKLYGMELLLSVFQAFPTEEERAEFLKFYGPYRQDGKLDYMKYLLPIYQAFPTNEKRAEFLKFCEPCREDGRLDYIKYLLPIYQAFPTNEERSDFIKFCEFYFVSINEQMEVYKMELLLSVFQAFPTDEERADFIKFCEPYREDERLDYIKYLLPIYQTFPTNEERADFIKFCEPYLILVRKEYKIPCMLALLSIYQTFPTAISRTLFMNFCKSCLKYVKRHEFGHLYHSESFLTIYQAFPTEEERADFIKFCEPYFSEKDDTTERLNSIQNFLIVYQNYREDFKKFEKRMKRIDMPVRESYLSRAYLRYMRVNAALDTEENPNTSRLQAMFETDIDHQIPAFYAQDKFLHILNGVSQKKRKLEAINAHVHEEIYKEDVQTFLERCALLGYKEKQGTTEYTLYNGKKLSKEHYKTYAEVEDFLSYLDTHVTKEKSIGGINGKQAVAHIKKVLGLEKSDTLFDSYLGNPMLFGKEKIGIFTGDQVLAATWYYLKLKDQHRNPNEYYFREELVKWLLDSIDEIESSSADMKCQTRITGEIIRKLSLHEEGLKIKPYVIREEDPSSPDNEMIKKLIKAAPEKAEILFKAFRQQESLRAINGFSSDQKTNDQRKPELWEIYQIYYDRLYCRTLNPDGITYKHDENILMRDAHGNLVKLYDINGNRRATPLIVYYQAEFQVLEQEFTELMRRHFELQRGLEY